MPGGKLLTPRLGAFALGVIGLLVILTALVVLPSSAGFGYDFRAYELAARRLASGVALYPPGTADAYNQGAYADLYLYPPPLAVLLIPITLLGTGAVTTWFVGRLILLALGDISTGPHNLSLATTLEAIGVGQSVARFAVPVGIIFAVAVTVLAARRRDAEVALVAAFTSALLFGPFFHPHYLVGLLLPAALLADRSWWLALGLPLLGWLPGEILPVVAVVASLATLWAPSAAHEHGGRRVSEGEPPPRILGDERQQAGLLIGTGDDGLGAPAIENR